jgi:hypothetical protein
MGIRINDVIDEVTATCPGVRGNGYVWLGWPMGLPTEAKVTFAYRDTNSAYGRLHKHDRYPRRR